MLAVVTRAVCAVYSSSFFPAVSITVCFSAEHRRCDTFVASSSSFFPAVLRNLPASFFLQAYRAAAILGSQNDSALALDDSVFHRAGNIFAELRMPGRIRTRDVQSA